MKVNSDCNSLIDIRNEISHRHAEELYGFKLLLEYGDEPSLIRVREIAEGERLDVLDWRVHRQSRRPDRIVSERTGLGLFGEVDIGLPDHYVPKVIGRLRTWKYENRLKHEKVIMIDLSYVAAKCRCCGLFREVSISFISHQIIIRGANMIFPNHSAMGPC